MAFEFIILKCLFYFFRALLVIELKSDFFSKLIFKEINTFLYFVTKQTNDRPAVAYKFNTLF